MQPIYNLNSLRSIIRIFFHQKHLEASTISAGRVPTSSSPLLRATNWARDSTELEVGAIAMHIRFVDVLVLTSRSSIPPAQSERSQSGRQGLGRPGKFCSLPNRYLQTDSYQGLVVGGTQGGRHSLTLIFFFPKGFSLTMILCVRQQM